MCSGCRRCARRTKAYRTRGTYRWTPWTGSGPRRSAFGAVLPPGNLNSAYIGWFSVLHAAFRADRSPSLRSAGRIDITELLRDALRRLRHPKDARHSPKAPRPKPADCRRGPVRPRLGFARGVCGARAPRGSRTLLWSDGSLQRVPWTAFRGPKHVISTLKHSLARPIQRTRAPPTRIERIDFRSTPVASTVVPKEVKRDILECF